MKILIYNLLFPIAFLAYLPFFLHKLKKRNGFRTGLGERFGFFRRNQIDRLRQLQNPVWIHAVSVGEVVAAIGFMQRWRQQQPQLEFVLSTTTSTGYQMATGKLPDKTVLIYSPIDFIFPVIRTLKLIKPRMLVIFEVEIWPNLITMANYFKVPTALINGRLSDRSAKRYARHRWFFRPLFKRFDCICVQSEDDVERVKRVTGLNAPVYVCNTMKFDQIPETEAGDFSGLFDQVFSGSAPEERLIWTAGSTHPGEEKLLVQVFKDIKQRFPGLKMVLVPRHFERADEVATCLKELQVSFCRRTGIGSADRDKVDVLLVDTTGELMDLYAAADLVYVGKSMAGNCGGHNIIEPALFGKPIIHGSCMDNFRLVVNLFKREQASIEVNNQEELRGAVLKLLQDSKYRKKLGNQARQVVEKYRGAMDKTLKRLEQLNNDKQK